ncbi:ATP-binding cassette domain-containing protein [Streptococcus sp. zg-JUN1979]|uniref:ATP-binding cassette domain-containing protein n=1 Tax=Streptococcus sp. zg-JUN1979 TaxID=3391450 RepID=UPI0039A752EC
MINFSHIYQHYNDKNVLEDITLDIKEGECFVLVGPSGSGKTTLLKMINRLVIPSQGSIQLDNKALESYDLRSLRLEIGYVLQHIALFPNLTVAENIALIPKMKGWSKERRDRDIKYLLDKAGLNPNDYWNRYPKELSGGEQQRVGILRAIITKPKLLLMDEPFSALDPISRRQLQDLTKNLQQEFKMTLVFVTHDMTEAMRLADRICVLHHGKILQIDSPENLKKSPKNAFVARLFEKEDKS